VAAALPACGSPQSSGLIDATGGKVVLSDGTQISIGAGALSTSTYVTVAVDDSAMALTGATPVGKAYLFGPEGQIFHVPVDVTLAVDVGALPADKTISDVLVYTAPAGSNEYTVLPTTVVDAQHVTAPTTHFSIFRPALAVSAPICEKGTHLGNGHCVPDDVIDMTAVVDMGPDLSGVDLAGADLSTSPDGGVCTPTTMGGGGTCSEVMACNGHTYNLNCTNTLCTCKFDGVQSGQAFQATGCASGWTICGFP
jgi:hypothetical protein